MKTAMHHDSRRGADAGVADAALPFVDVLSF